MSKNKTSKYLKYAIGEIALVVFGILIALQINNWNEGRKDANLAKTYLQGIKSDFQKDIDQIDIISNDHIQSISLINSIDSVFNIKYIHNPKKHKNIFVKPDTSATNVKLLFYRNFSFRSTRGTYNALISDGKTNLINNKILFEQIQKIYEEYQERINSIYKTIKRREDAINWAYPFEKKNLTFADLKKAKGEKIFLDLSNFTEEKYFYCTSLYNLKSEMNEAIDLINKEVEN